MKVLVLYSGGKDSNYALYLAKKRFGRVDGVVTFIPKNPESYMLHYHNVRFTDLQAKAMGVKRYCFEVSGEKEKEVEEMEGFLSTLNPDIVVSGALASKYQYERVQRICANIGAEHFAPLWGKDPEEEWLEILKLGFEVMIVSVSAMGLGQEWLGRVVDFNAFQKLKDLARRYSFHLSFEGGEAETFVLWAPTFKRRIRVKRMEKVWEGVSGYVIIKEAEVI